MTQIGYDRFILNVVRTHVQSPQLLAFLFALAPPATAANIRGNLLEELGVAEAGGEAHPALLEKLIREAGLEDRLDDCRASAQLDLRRVVAQPLLYGTLKETGLAALVEVTAFEYMLSQIADRMATALMTHRGLSLAAVEWFTHHGLVDVAHAELGLRNIELYVDYYAIDDGDASTIIEIAMRENVFIKRYFAELAS